MKTKWHELAAIFIFASASLLFEITVTKIFEFSLWSNYAYLVISTAMFGLGLSGVILTRWPGLLEIHDRVYLSISTVLSALTMFIAFLVVNYVPIHLPDAPDGWGKELLNVGVVFFSLGTPFFFFGLVITYLLDRRGEKANIYYFADLIGAGLGSFILVPLIPLIEPQGLVLLCVYMSLSSALLFMMGSANRKVPVAVTTGIIALAALGYVSLPHISEKIPLNVHVVKRTYTLDKEAGKIEASGWSALSRVDIAPLGPKRKRVWIAAGVNESSIRKFDGDYEAARAKRDFLMERAPYILDHKILPHLSKTNHTVCMIGTSGGEDSLYALMTGARKVVGIEMDPMIAKFVTEDYRDYAGGLFTDGDYSELIIDEGRSYLRRSDRKFDVIQQVNNFTPIAFQNGALNLSETYLLTVESFKDFYDHLTDDGILCISRWGSIRLLSNAVEMFRRMGMKPEEYSKHLLVCEGGNWVINSFMMKKSPWTKEEIDAIFKFFSIGNHGRNILYAPYRKADLLDKGNNLYYNIATSEDPSQHWKMGCYNFTPSTDNKPFFNRFKILGKADRNRSRFTMLPGEIRHVLPKNTIDRRVPPGDLPPIIILFEALIMATVFFGIPMFSKKELREPLMQNRKVLGYFACIGIAFILVEICMIQKLVLFLGAPVYSIAAVFCSILVFAGLGSLCSGAIKEPSPANIRNLLLTVAVVVLLVHFLTPVITRMFLGHSLTTRILVALLFTGTAGFVMGMPMPTGIRYLKASGKSVIPWAWAVNGYFTVIGSAGTVLIAANFGFTTVFIIAALTYAAAPLFLNERLKKQ